MHLSLRVAITALGVLPFLAPVANAASGEQWEYTMTLEAPGTSMPMGTAKICIASSAALKPNLRDDCKLVDYKASGSKATFKAACSVPGPSTMGGEMTRAGDVVSGTLRMTQGGNETVIKQVGRKLGTCANPVG
jgi:hypothetical protein